MTGSSSNREETYNVLNELYNQINKLSNIQSNTSRVYLNPNSNISPFGRHPTLTETSRSENNTCNNNYNLEKIKFTPQEATKVMDSLVEKLAKKYTFNEEKMMESNSHLNNINKQGNLYGSKVFNNLLTKFENNKEIDFNNLNNVHQVDSNRKISDFQNSAGNYFTSKEAYEEENDLPHFGGPSPEDMKQNYKSHAQNSKVNLQLQLNNSQEEIIVAHQNQVGLNSHQKDGNKNTKSIPNNPNNSLKNDSHLEDDSIFNEIENPHNPGQNQFINKEKFTSKFEPNNNLDNLIKSNLNTNLFSLINSNQEKENPDQINQSSFFQNSQSMIIQSALDDSNIQGNSVLDEYVDDDDPGFDLYECDQEFFKETCKKLSEQYDYPRRAVLKSKFKNNENLTKIVNENNPNESLLMKSIKAKDMELINSKKNVKNDKLYEIESNLNNNNNNNNINTVNAPTTQANPKKSLLPTDVKFMESGSTFYPIHYINVIYDCFNLKVIVDRERTGFEESKEFKIVVNSLIAGRYQVLDYLGSAAFSKAIKCLDIVDNKIVCLKIIENNKDYVDQSIDEIKLLRYINANGDPDKVHFLRLHDYFYHKEHLFIVTELLKDNLYDFYKYINENNVENYFTLGRLQKITKQILTCLNFLHGLKLIHCDLKPENILMKSITDVSVKVIDFGSSCFIHDHLSSYVQSRSYRAPEVILGCKYDFKIDTWSLGCILAELYTGNVLFQNDSVQSLLARVRKF
jgi:hypothetical protein